MLSYLVIGLMGTKWALYVLSSSVDSVSMTARHLSSIGRVSPLSLTNDELKRHVKPWLLKPASLQSLLCVHPTLTRVGMTFGNRFFLQNWRHRLNPSIVSDHRKKFCIRVTLTDILVPFVSASLLCCLQTSLVVASHRASLVLLHVLPKLPSR